MGFGLGFTSQVRDTTVFQSEGSRRSQKVSDGPDQAMKKPDDPNRRTKASYGWKKKALTEGSRLPFVKSLTA